MIRSRAWTWKSWSPHLNLKLWASFVFSQQFWVSPPVWCFWPGKTHTHTHIIMTDADDPNRREGDTPLPWAHVSSSSWPLPLRSSSFLSWRLHSGVIGALQAWTKTTGKNVWCPVKRRQCLHENAFRWDTAGEHWTTSAEENVGTFSKAPPNFKSGQKTPSGRRSCYLLTRYVYSVPWRFFFVQLDV